VVVVVVDARSGSDVALFDDELHAANSNASETVNTMYRRNAIPLRGDGTSSVRCPPMSDPRDTESVERVVPAPAEKIFDLLADPSRHRELDGSGSVRDAKEPSHRVKLGDTFGIVYPELQPYIVPACAPVQFEQDALHESVARLLAQRPELMYLTHYGAVRDAEKLAVQFLAQVDAMADAARSLASAPGRHDKLKRAFGDIYIAELRRCGSRESEDFLREILATDIELNAQGLGTWLDRN